ncbi:MAG: NADPH:quinone reductase, partial [Actinomycetota bacterium]|nr:NADPH:quinone reductase [Actinomycetota bacterium]
TVISTASSLDRLDPLKELGLDHAVDYSQSGWVDAVRELTGGRGVDLAVDSVGGRILEGSVQCLAYRGRAITVGNAGRDRQPFDLSLLSAGNQSITSVFLGAEILNPRTYAMIAGLVDDVAAGRLEVIVDRLFPLSEAADAHAYIESRQAVGRVVLIP